MNSREKHSPVEMGDEVESKSLLGYTPKSQSQRQPRRYKDIVIAIVLATTLSSLLTVLVARSSGQKTPSPNHIPSILESPCGSTPDEARARGCYFDIISFCWLPDACYDAELSTAFDNMTTWAWFEDSERTKPISHQQAMTGQFTGLYVNWEYHLRHCTAMWEKLHRAVLGPGKRAIDGYIGPIEHTKHCSQMLLQDRDVAFETINTIILVKYPACGIA